MTDLRAAPAWMLRLRPVAAVVLTETILLAAFARPNGMAVLIALATGLVVAAYATVLGMTQLPVKEGDRRWIPVMVGSMALLYLSAIAGLVRFALVAVA